MAKARSIEQIRQDVVKLLTTEGEYIIKRAYEMRNWKNRTGNLHDSYGSAVFVNGQLQRNSVKFVGQAIADPSKADKEVGDFKGERTRAQRGSSHRQFGNTGDKRYLTGDTVLAEGRDEINKFFNSYKATPNGIELVVAAVMYYAKILESGKYQVISSAATSLNRVANNLGKGVEIYALELNRKAGEIASNAFNVRLGQKIR